MEVCNETGETLNVSVVLPEMDYWFYLGTKKVHHTEFRHYYSKGWWRIDSGECEVVYENRFDMVGFNWAYL